MKKVYVRILVLLFILIPTLIAVIAFFTANATPVKLNSVDCIDILTPNGISYTVDKNNDSENFIGLAIAMNENAVKQIALPDQLVNSPHFTFVYHALGSKSEYSYYFSDDIDSAYYVNSNGVCYLIAEEYTEQFLSTEYSHCIFDYNQPPAATLNSNTLTPSAANWQFKNYKGDFISSITSTGVNDEIETYGTPDIGFEIEPDMLTVTLKDGENIIYEGLYDELSNNSISHVIADAHIVATWYDDSSRAYRGELSYDIKINFKEPPVFYLSSNSAVTGNILTISVLNAENTSDINITCEPDIGCDFNFIKGEKYAHALIPVSRDVIPGTYTLTADYNGQSKTEFTIDVSSDYKEAYAYNVEETLFDSVYNEANITEYNTLFNSFFSSSSETPLFDGKFISGLPYGTFESADYGTFLTISNNDVSFENQGKYYTCTRESEIKAVNSGKVIYTGNNPLAGQIVAVDHGMGLVSVYKHLGSISVNEGDAVTQDTVLGVSGRTGFMSKKGAGSTVARVEVYVNTIPVDIDPLINNGIVFTD